MNEAHSRWLLKTEPEDYSWADLVRDGSTVWDGVSAPLAVKHLQAMKPGDCVFIYHSGRQRAVVGTGRVEQTGDGPPVIAPGAPLHRAVPLAEIRTMPEFNDTYLVRMPRLSVVPIGEQQWRAITLAGTENQ